MPSVNFSRHADAARRSPGDCGSAQGWPVEDTIKEWGFGRAAYSFGFNSRVSAARAGKELAWQPTLDCVPGWIENRVTMRSQSCERLGISPVQNIAFSSS